MARAAILREMGSVFGAYKIQVDQRHLELIADYMVRGRPDRWLFLSNAQSRRLMAVTSLSTDKVSRPTLRRC
jgi:hypothetical protein